MPWGGQFIDKAAGIFASVSAFGTLIISFFSLRKLNEVHVQINSRMDELLRMAGLLGKAEGKVEGKAEEKAEAAKPPVDNIPK